jgi:hypothetical protein
MVFNSRVCLTLAVFFIAMSLLVFMACSVAAILLIEKGNKSGAEISLKVAGGLCLALLLAATTSAGCAFVKSHREASKGSDCLMFLH